MKIKLVYLFMFGILCILNAPAFAAIAGPYTVDADTLHLYHLDEANGVASCADAVGTQNLNGVWNVVSADYPAGVNNNQGITPALLGNTPYAGTPGFGTAADFSANALSIVGNTSTNPCNPAPHRPILLGGSNLSTNDSTDNVPFSFAGSNGAFTFEAIVKLDFDPTVAYRNVATSTSNPTAGSYPMEIICGDRDNGTAANRTWQFRLDQYGFSAGGSTAAKLEFNNIGLNTDLFAVIPTTGPNAINNTDWFHVAVTYNGNDNTANNFAFYWTKMDPNNTVDNQLVTVNSSGNTPTTWMSDLNNALTPSFSIGDESRDTGTGTGEGESFVGSIDEVRISDMARGAGQMMFVPEPAISLMALIGILGMGLIWLRKRS